VELTNEDKWLSRFRVIGAYLLIALQLTIIYRINFLWITAMVMIPECLRISDGFEAWKVRRQARNDLPDGIPRARILTAGDKRRHFNQLMVESMAEKKFHCGGVLCGVPWCTCRGNQPYQPLQLSEGNGEG